MAPVSRLELYQIWKEKCGTGKSHSDANKAVFQFIIARCPDVGTAVKRTLQQDCARLCYVFLQKLRKWNRNSARFLQKEAQWLGGSFESSEAQIKPSRKNKVGPPLKQFSNLSDRVKAQKMRDLANNNCIESLAGALSRSLLDRGKKAAAQVVGKVIESPKAEEILKTLTGENPPVEKWSPDKALAISLDTGLTKQNYQDLRNASLESKSDMFPTYEKLREAKIAACPPSTAISITETSAEVTLQALVDHTAERKLMDVEVSDQETRLTMISKWGFDGSSDHSTYKQTFSADNCSDSHFLLTSLVPLAIQGTDSKKTIWENSSPGSKKNCRPIRLQNLKETPDVTHSEKNYVTNQIVTLKETKCRTKSGIEVVVVHILVMSMVDGKVCSTLEETASSNCHVRGATPKEMNSLEKLLLKPSRPTGLAYGMAPLHAYIRACECLPHIAYRLDFQQWRAVTKEQKDQVTKQKFRIQEEFRKETGLIIDKPRSGGSGTSTDGNTARRFFRQPEVTARITGIDETLIHRFAVILRALNCGAEINVAKFREYALETYQVYVASYSWYYMPQSIHKILIHGAEVIETSILPVGMLSEEAQETRHRDLRSFRQHFTRKCSRESTMEDLFNRLLVTSDPRISSLRRCSKKTQERESDEVSALILTESS